METCDVGNLHPNNEYRYSLFGMAVSSYMALPALTIDKSPKKTPDIIFKLGRTKFTNQGTDQDIFEIYDSQAYLDRGNDALSLDIPDIGCFKIEGGHTITIEPDEAASDELVAVYLLGTAVGILLHQRDILPIHANAVVMDGHAILFCGDSGAGKSTLARYFQKSGFTVLTDDVCAVNFGQNGHPVAYPGLPRIKLWEDALEQLGHNGLAIKPVAWTDSKFEIRSADQDRMQKYPIAAICHLLSSEDHGAAGLYRVSGLDAMNVISANIYRRGFADLAGKTKSYLRNGVKLAEATPVYRMVRNMGFENFEDEIRAVEIQLKDLIKQMRISANEGNNA